MTGKLITFNNFIVTKSKIQPKIIPHHSKLWTLTEIIKVFQTVDPEEPTNIHTIK